MQRAMDDAVIPENNPRRKKLSRGTKKYVSVVPSHFIQTDVSGVKGETSIFSNMIFCILLSCTFYITDLLCILIMMFPIHERNAA